MRRLLLAASLLWPVTASALPPPEGSPDWEAMAPFKEWITSQTDQIGRWCCDIGDGRPVEACRSVVDPNTGPCEPGKGSVWWVHITKKHFPDEPEHWLKVEVDRPIRDKNDPNPTGHNIVWLYNGRVQCFSPSEGM